MVLAMEFDSAISAGSPRRIFHLRLRHWFGDLEMTAGQAYFSPCLTQAGTPQYQGIGKKKACLLSP